MVIESFAEDTQRAHEAFAAKKTSRAHTFPLAAVKVLRTFDCVGSARQSGESQMFSTRTRGRLSARKKASVKQLSIPSLAPRTCVCGVVCLIAREYWHSHDATKKGILFAPAYRMETLGGALSRISPITDYLYLSGFACITEAKVCTLFFSSLQSIHSSCKCLASRVLWMRRMYHEEMVVPAMTMSV